MPSYTREIEGYLPLFCEICRAITTFEVRRVRQVLPKTTRGTESVLYCHEAECEACGIRCVVDFESLGVLAEKMIPEHPAARAHEIFGDDHYVTNRVEIEKNLDAGLLTTEQHDGLPWLVYQAVAMDAQIPCWIPGEESKGWFRACLLVIAGLCLMVVVCCVTPTMNRTTWMAPIGGLAAFFWWLNLFIDHVRDKFARWRMDDLVTCWLARGLAPLEPTGHMLSTVHQQVMHYGWPYPRVTHVEILRSIERMDVRRIEPGTDDEINRLLERVPRAAECVGDRVRR